MNKKSLFKRLFATLTSLTVLATCTLTTAFFASANEETIVTPTPYNMEVISDTQRIYSGENYEVDYSITSAWDNNQMISVTVTNTGTEPIGNWSLFYDFGGEIQNIYNAEVIENDYFDYVAHSNNNFGEITPNSSTNFGYTLVGAESNYFPNSIDMVQSRQTISEGLTIELINISNNYDTFGGQLILTNTTDNQICMPEITINTNFSLLSNWGYDIIDLDENSYTIKSKFDTGIFINIPPNSSYTLQISGSNVENPQIESFSATELVVSVEEYVSRDSDGDYLPDYYENYICSDKYNPDTDGDLLIDGYEELILETSPLLPDTDGNEVSDADEDFDTDSLTNLQEYELVTDPLEPDTDTDKLNDGEEISLGTDPLVPDSDIDGLLDGTEIELGLDPLNPDTDGDGILDGDETTTQIIDLALTETTSVTPSVTITGQGDFTGKLLAENISHNKVVGELPYLVGEPFDFIHDDSLTFETSTLTFELSEELLAENDINDLFIFYFNEETGGIEFLDTEIIGENKISTNVEHYSIYGIGSLSQLYYSSQLNNSEDIIENPLIDLVFIIDSTGSMSSSINNVKTGIDNLINRFNKSNISVRLGLVEYKDITSDGIDSTKVYGWSENAAEFKNKLSQFNISGGGDTPESAIDGIDKARRMAGYSNAPKYFILITDADYKDQINDNGTVKAGYNMLREALTLKENKISTSVITKSNYYTTYYTLISETNGIYANIDDDFSNSLYPLITQTNAEVNDGFWVRLSNFQLVKLAKDPNLGDFSVDTDGDGIPDLEELSTKRTMSIGVYPTLGIRPVTVWDYKSNPAQDDTDGDSLLDGEKQIVSVGDSYWIPYTVAPKDDSPKRYTGPNGLWKTHIERVRFEGTYEWAQEFPNWEPSISSNIKSAALKKTRDTLAEDDEKVIQSRIEDIIDMGVGLKSGETVYNALTEEKFRWNFVRKQFEKGILTDYQGASILDMKYDDKGDIHALTSAWQRVYGYNQYYDYFFNIGTYMNAETFDFFNDSGEKYRLWMWKGDYLNLGSGTEIGLYKYSHTYNNTEHFDCVDFELPMTLNLYASLDSTKAFGSEYIDSAYYPVLSWYPREYQWWITGFAPKITNIKPEEMYTIGSINFSKQSEELDFSDLYEEFKETMNLPANSSKKQFLIFDDENKTVWVMW